MERRLNLSLIILFVAIALAGLISVQVYWAYMTYRLSEKEFTVHVKEALKQTTNEINKQLIHYETFSKVHLRAGEGFYLIRNKWANNKFLDRADTIPFYYDNPDYQDLFKWNKLMFTGGVNISIVFQYEYTTSRKDTTDNYANSFEKATVKTYRDAFSEDRSIEERYPPRLFDSLMQKNLQAVSIDEEYSFAYIGAESKKIVYLQHAADTAAVLASPFSTRLTASPYFTRAFDVSLVFRNYSGHLLRGIGRLLTVSAMIVLLLLFSFFFFARMVLKQRRLSELKNDFINNMTHEFKTPLTNISLALETMSEQKFINGEKEETMMRIIGRENERLRENIDRILQIARFEKEKIHLVPDTIDVHQLIKKVISAFDVYSGKREIIFQCRFNSATGMLLVDETHFFNLIYNLVDNAVKYNLKRPEISIGTRDRPDGIIITVKDNGIGIPSADQKNIFQKFYRVHKGDLHDVKGYGLGLSYVKLIVESHHGHIKVSSQPGQGSEFEIFIPTQP
ncbi:MAG TPA: HAMP domain-containing sensor histidine kinase [Bacteroidia bacterium]|nr:HAMP domain-containing sensor histidine kinase [Bacteroidia bacterium]